VPAGFAARAPKGKELTGVSKGVNELAQWGSFENMHDLLGGLLGAKNVGVTNLPHLK
jgi:hypothetical protein